MSLRDKVVAYNRETKEALRLVWDALNAGQRKKLLRDPAVAALMKRYEVNTDDEH